MLPKTSTFKSLSYYKTPLNIPRFGRKYFSYSRHVGIPVRVAGVHLPSNVSLKVSHFVSSSVIHLSLLPSTQINCNRRAGKAREHTEVLVWYLVTKESKTAACYLVFQQIKLGSGHKPIFDHQIELSRKICMFRCKNHLSIQGKNSNSKTFQKTKQLFTSASQESPAMSGASASVCRFLQSSRAHAPLPRLLPSLLPPGYTHLFGGKNQPNYLQRKAPFVFN